MSNLPKIDSHLHTTWTDGEASVYEMYCEAVKKNLTHILFSEHSRKTSTDWFYKFASEVRNLPSYPCKAYVGAEVKIETYHGDIDTNEEIIGLTDFVMASVHRLIDSSGQTLQFSETNPDDVIDLEFQLTWAALENPNVDILGHLFGMSYRRFNLSPPEEKIHALIEKASKFNVAIEINSHYHPDPKKMISCCQEYSALTTFGSNAHSLATVGEIIQHLDENNRQI